MTNPRRRKHGSSSLLLTERILIYAMGMGLLLLPVRAHALQPLAEFLHHAAELNFDNREARATAVQRVHEATQAWGHLLPALTMQADYIRNQYLGAANIPTGAAPGSNGVLPTHHVVMSPVDQWDLTFSAALPLIDVAAWNNVGAGAANQEAQRERMAATALEVQKTVARTYYQLVGARAVARKPCIVGNRLMRTCRRLFGRHRGPREQERKEAGTGQGGPQQGMPASHFPLAQM